jgi:hypothetical protein
LISKRVELVVILACEAEVFDRLIGSVQLPFFLLFDTGREILFVFGCCFIAFPPKKLRCGWLSTGLALALAWPSRRFFFSHGSPISSIFTAAHAVAQSSARRRLPKWLVGKEGNRTLLDVSK